MQTAQLWKLYPKSYMLVYQLRIIYRDLTTPNKPWATSTLQIIRMLQGMFTMLVCLWLGGVIGLFMLPDKWLLPIVLVLIIPGMWVTSRVYVPTKWTNSWRENYRSRKYPAVRQQLDKYLQRGEYPLAFLPAIEINNETYFFIAYYTKTFTEYRRAETEPRQPIGALILSSTGEILTSEAKFHELLQYWRLLQESGTCKGIEINDFQHLGSKFHINWFTEEYIIAPLNKYGADHLTTAQLETMLAIGHLFQQFFVWELDNWQVKLQYFEQNWSKTHFTAAELQPLLASYRHMDMNLDKFYAEIEAENGCVHTYLRDHQDDVADLTDLPPLLVLARNSIDEVLRQFITLPEETRRDWPIYQDFMESDNASIFFIANPGQPPRGDLSWLWDGPEFAGSIIGMPKVTGLSNIAYDLHFRAWKSRTEQATGRKITP